MWPIHNLRRDFNQHSNIEYHDALAPFFSLNCSGNSWFHWWLSSLCWMCWRFLQYCSVHLKASDIVRVSEKCQLESNFHAFTAYSKTYNFAWCFPHFLLFQNWSIYFCYLLHCKLPKNTLSPLLYACKKPATVWLSFFLGLQGAATINMRMESLNKLLIVAQSGECVWGNLLGFFFPIIKYYFSH